MRRAFAVLCLILSGCATFQEDPATGRTAFSPQGAALDARAFALVAEGAAAELEPGGLRDDILEAVDLLRTLASAWDLVAAGDEAEPAMTIETVLGLADAILEQLDADAAERWGPYIRSVRVSLELARLYSE